MNCPPAEVYLSDLVSTHMVCKRLSAMHYHIRSYQNFVPPLKYLRNVVSRVPPPPLKNEKLVMTWDFE